LLMPSIAFVATSRDNVATMPQVSIRELRNKLTSYLHRVEEGEQVTVTRRGKPVAVVTPVAGQDELTGKLQELAAKGMIRWSGRKPKVHGRRVKLHGEGPGISEMLLEDRR
jgi:prevent-host-death family protein